MEWTREKSLELIDEFERQPCLWNPKHGLYFNKIRKFDAWEAISRKIECNSAEAKKKIDSMLSSFRREKAKGKKSVGTGKGATEIYVSKWYAFQRMAFLLDKDQPRLTMDSIDENSDSTEEQHIDSEASENGDEENQTHAEGVAVTEGEGHAVERSEEPTDLPTSSAINTESDVTTRVKKLKRKTINKRQTEDSSMDKALGYLKTAVANNTTKSDESGVYGQFVAHKLRNFKPKTRALIQHHINNILFHAEMGQYDVVETMNYQGTLHSAPNYPHIFPQTPAVTQLPSFQISSDFPISNQRCSNQTYVPTSSSHSQLFGSSQSSRNHTPVSTPLPNSQLSYPYQSPPNKIPVATSSPNWQLPYSSQSSHNHTPVPTPSPNSQVSPPYQSPSNQIPVEASSPNSQLSYTSQLSRNHIPVSSPSPNSHFSYPYQSSFDQSPILSPAQRSKSIIESSYPSFEPASDYSGDKTNVNLHTEENFFN